MKSFQHKNRVGQADEWLTPPHILRALGEFDLDPCSPRKRPWDTARVHLTRDDDGLSRPWAGRVWLNPPFGAQAKRWLERMAQHGNGVALLAARTDTAAFAEYIWDAADAVCFLYGRVRFCRVDGVPAAAALNAPVCLVAYGAVNAACLHTCTLGKTLSINPVRRKMPAGFFT